MRVDAGAPRAPRHLPVPRRVQRILRGVPPHVVLPAHGIRLQEGTRIPGGAARTRSRQVSSHTIMPQAPEYIIAV